MLLMLTGFSQTFLPAAHCWTIWHKTTWDLDHHYPAWGHGQLCTILYSVQLDTTGHSLQAICYRSMSSSARETMTKYHVVRFLPTTWHVMRTIWYHHDAPFARQICIIHHAVTSSYKVSWLTKSLDCLLSSDPNWHCYSRVDILSQDNLPSFQPEHCDYTIVKYCNTYTGIQNSQNTTDYSTVKYCNTYTMLLWTRERYVI